VKLLLDHKADVNASRYDDGSTPFYSAALNGHAEVVKLLLENRADVNARKHNGFTPDPYADVDGVGGGVWVNFHRRRRRADDF